MEFGDSLMAAEDRRKGEKVLLQRHMWCPTTVKVKGLR